MHLMYVPHFHHPSSSITSTPLNPVVDLTTSVASNTSSAKSPAKSNVWIERGTIQLQASHKDILMSRSAWLDDQILTAAQFMLKEQYPHIGGFQATVLGQGLLMPPPAMEFVQILHIFRCHWITVSTVHCTPGTIKVYDSKIRGILPDEGKKLICSLMQWKGREISLEFIDVQSQKGSSACGLFALAFLVSICEGHDPAVKFYSQLEMRSHLLKCLENNAVVEFPSSSARVPNEPIKEALPIYCLCLSVEAGNMIQCDLCDRWYHTDCVNVGKEFEGDSYLAWKCSICDEGILL